MMPLSPQLPVFGIRDLTGPENPPGLISITSREYDSTIHSEPSAKLLYLDEDDGELITVGSALELSQRLEEPVPRYTRHDVSETRNPLDGQLVHVFDINRTPGSLIVWTDHEAYSSKHLRRPISPSQASASPFADPVESMLTIRSDNSRLPTSDIKSGREAPEKEQGSTLEERGKCVVTDTRSAKILDGIENHLSGLANVLHIAAITLQKAADKTRDRDTSVVEDILKGVKNILNEVGSFGLEAYKAFEDETNNASNWATPSGDRLAVNENEIEQTPSEALSLEPEDLALDEAERSPTRPITIDDNRSSTRVKFAATVTDVTDEQADPSESPISSTLADTAESFSEKRKRDEMGECERAIPSPVTNPSILDDGNEDADFTARYPPLMSIRRAHTVSGLYGRENMRGSRRGERESQPPLYKPASHHNIFTHCSQSVDKPDVSETVPKPIPGAWPNLKNESASALPTSGESSGAFFNRMTGRDRTREVSSFVLHRANTTAASNPASRLNGPFDPGFPYQPSDLRADASFRSRRPFTSSNRARYQPPWARSAREDSAPTDFRVWKDYAKDESESGLHAKRSMPAMRHNAQPVFVERSSTLNALDGRPAESTNFESSRIVKHHRSVPQFHMNSPQFHPRDPESESASKPQRNLDLLTGPSMAPLGLNSSSAEASAPFYPKPLNVQTFTRPAPNASNKTNAFVNSIQSQPYKLAAPPFSLGNQSYGFSRHSSHPPVFSTSATPFHPSITKLDREPEERGSSFNFAPTSQISIDPPAESEQTKPKPARPPKKNKFDQCVEHLKLLGFGTDDSLVRDRLHVYAVAAEGDVTEAVEMIEEDRRVSGTFC